MQSNRRTNRKAEEQNETKHDSMTSKERTALVSLSEKPGSLSLKWQGCTPISFLSVYVLLAAASFSPEVSCLLVRRFASHFIEDF